MTWVLTDCSMEIKAKRARVDAESHSRLLSILTTVRQSYEGRGGQQ